MVKISPQTFGLFPETADFAHTRGLQPHVQVSRAARFWPALPSVMEAAGLCKGCFVEQWSFPLAHIGSTWGALENTVARVSLPGILTQLAWHVAWA